MSRNESLDSTLNHDVLAFEYVTGVMRGAERATFEAVMKNNPHLERQVQFWEEQLIQLADENETRVPSPDAWMAIQSVISGDQFIQTEKPIQAGKISVPFWQVWFSPALASLCTLFLVGVLWLAVAHKQDSPNVDYVAVLTDVKGSAHLTVLTATKGSALWLKWNGVKISENKNVQLWAVSKRDGQIRTLGVFTDTQATQVALSQANWRLIKDAEVLMLTEEEVGGSATDEPSEKLLAKGVCVLLADVKKTI